MENDTSLTRQKALVKERTPRGSEGSHRNAKTHKLQGDRSRPPRNWKVRKDTPSTQAGSKTVKERNGRKTTEKEPGSKKDNIGARKPHRGRKKEETPEGVDTQDKRQRTNGNQPGEAPKKTGKQQPNGNTTS